jgi:hypothetical protein
MRRDSRLGDEVAAVVAVGLGLLVAAIDRAEPFGDDSAKSTIVLWLAAGAVLGFARPRRPWRWALLIGPMVPAAYLTLHVLGRARIAPPNNVATFLVLVPISIAVGMLGAYTGAWGRRAIWPPSPKADAPRAGA